ncbi:hypothetical protein Q8A67_018077 [Cirrhinus molitorella]|uniref:Uncharacterized protein n=1 Tax=Cirrhinus molitorella TaxID=172907 RepID=A0AA88PGY5_9TELE|nr:hypothetical protein Q8A67_018077 [Cirrhinus molitorella]
MTRALSLGARARTHRQGGKGYNSKESSFLSSFLDSSYGSGTADSGSSRKAASLERTRRKPPSPPDVRRIV